LLVLYFICYIELKFMDEPRRLYPLFLDLVGKPVLVVGGGAVGGQKAAALLLAGAAVTVVAPAVGSVVAEAAALGRLRWHARPFAPADVEGAWLIIAATGDAAVNAEVARCGAAARVFVNAVDDPAHAAAYSGAVLTRGPVTAAFSTGGRAPAMARLLRDLCAAVLPAEGELRAWMERAEALRPRWRQAAVPMGSRYGELLRELLHALTPAAGESRSA
jgi:uroporphyrin-III C-methyltransferase/precorrin-2 dehydrogenase/sirohydrochlorin ferrochelatase